MHNLKRREDNTITRWTVASLGKSGCWSVQVSTLPRLSPSGPLSIRHSSICPYGENISRMSFSLHFLEIIPINSFLSSTAVLSTTQHQTQLLWAELQRNTTLNMHMCLLCQRKDDYLPTRQLGVSSPYTTIIRSSPQSLVTTFDNKK